MDETQTKLDKKVGDKELQVLKPAKVLIAGVKLDPKTVKGKTKDIVKIICKHPEREEPIEISKVKLVKGNTVKVSGLWYDEDEDGNIQKGSAIAELLNYCEAGSLRELEGHEVDTAKESDSSNYLVLKVY